MGRRVTGNRTPPSSRKFRRRACFPSSGRSFSCASSGQFLLGAPVKCQPHRTALPAAPPLGRDQTPSPALRAACAPPSCAKTPEHTLEPRASHAQHNVEAASLPGPRAQVRQGRWTCPVQPPARHSHVGPCPPASNLARWPPAASGRQLLCLRKNGMTPPPSVHLP